MGIYIYVSDYIIRRRKGEYITDHRLRIRLVFLSVNIGGVRAAGRKEQCDDGEQDQDSGELFVFHFLFLSVKVVMTYIIIR